MVTVAGTQPAYMYAVKLLHLTLLHIDDALSLISSRSMAVCL